MAKIDAIDVPKLTWPEAAAPSTPASGKVVTYAKSDGKMYSKDDAGTETLMSGGTGGGGGFAQIAIATRTAGDLTTSSTTYVDATGLTVTLTTGATRCMVIFNGNAIVTSTAAGSIDVAVDGTRQGQAYGSAIFQGSGASRSCSFTLMTGVLSAGSHTIKIQWKVDNGAATGTLYASTTVSAATITVLETNLTT